MTVAMAEMQFVLAAVARSEHFDFAQAAPKAGSEDAPGADFEVAAEAAPVA